MHELSNCPVCKGEKPQVFMTARDYFLTCEQFSIVRCGDCGFLFTNPRPAEDQLPAYYQSSDYVSHSNTSKGLINRLYQLVRNYSLRGKVKLVSIYKKKGHVLDIGCGTGHFLQHLRRNHYEAVGVEPEKTARDHAIQQFNLTVYSDLRQVPGSSTFDVITLWHVLEHVFDLNAYLTRISKLLERDGILVVAVPNPDSHDAQHYGKYWAAWDLPRHLYHFTRESMQSLAGKHSFDIIAVMPMKFDSYYVSLLSEKYKTGRNNYLKAFLTGWRSNHKAKSQKNNYSSLIYILKPKN